jgi:hypothetical protein
MGPRKKVDIGSLRSLPRDERIRLLIESVAECGGKPESLNGGTFRRRLVRAHKVSGHST